MYSSCGCGGYYGSSLYYGFGGVVIMVMVAGEIVLVVLIMVLDVVVDVFWVYVI